MRASDRAYSSLREEILEGVLTPGAVLGEVEQSARLGISRTPLREAVSRLVADGLAEPSAGRGVMVTAVSLSEARQLFDLRIALEVLAARRAAERAAEPSSGSAPDSPAPDSLTPRETFSALAERFENSIPALSTGTDPTQYYALTSQLDTALDAASGNSYLAEHLRGLRLHLARLRRLARNSPARLAASAQEHAAITRAIAAGDPDLAAATTVVHLHQALAHLLAESPDPGDSTESERSAPRTAPSSTDTLPPSTLQESHS